MAQDHTVSSPVGTAEPPVDIVRAERPHATDVDARAASDRDLAGLASIAGASEIGRAAASIAAAPVRRLNRQAILSSDDIKYEDVPVPEWDGVVRIRGLTSGERDALEASCMVQEGKKQKFSSLNFRAKLVVKSAVNEDGSPIFTEHDAIELARKSAGAVNKLAEVAMKLSRITDEDVEELAKNSESGRADASSSGLR